MTAEDSMIMRAGVDDVDERDYEGRRKVVDERDYEGRRRLRGREGLRGEAEAETTWTRGITRAGGDYLGEATNLLFCATEGVLLRGRGHYALAGAARLLMRTRSLLRMALRRLSLRYVLTGDDVVNRARQYSWR